MGFFSAWKIFKRNIKRGTSNPMWSGIKSVVINFNSVVHNFIYSNYSIVKCLIRYLKVLFTINTCYLWRTKKEQLLAFINHERVVKMQLVLQNDWEQTLQYLMEAGWQHSRFSIGRTMTMFQLHHLISVRLWKIPSMNLKFLI